MPRKLKRHKVYSFAAIQAYLVSLNKPLSLLYFLLPVALFRKLMKASLLRAGRFRKAGRFVVNITLSIKGRNMM
jgi:hypothetical protein